MAQELVAEVQQDSSGAGGHWQTACCGEPPAVPATAAAEAMHGGRAKELGARLDETRSEMLAAQAALQDDVRALRNDVQRLQMDGLHADVQRLIGLLAGRGALDTEGVGEPNLLRT
eukprot:7080671-Prymnesium_polylepis.2